MKRRTASCSVCGLACCVFICEHIFDRFDAPSGYMSEMRCMYYKLKFFGFIVLYYDSNICWNAVYTVNLWVCFSLNGLVTIVMGGKYRTYGSFHIIYMIDWESKRARKTNGQLKHFALLLIKRHSIYTWKKTFSLFSTVRKKSNRRVSVCVVR